MLSRDVIQLRERVRHWQNELGKTDLRGTLTVGIVHSSLTAYERVFTSLILALVECLDEVGTAAYKLQKLHSKSALGNKTNLVFNLKPHIQRAIKKSQGNIADDILNQADIDVLQQLLTYRNKFDHGHLEFAMVEPATSEDIERLVLSFCDSSLVKSAMKMSR